MASTFVDLQQQRHLADYDVHIRFTRATAMECIEQAEAAVAKWTAIRHDPSARLYLVALFAFDEFRR